MYDGIYEVSFTAPLSQFDFGVGGIVTIKDGSINGGDEGYAYAGKLTVDEQGRATGRVKVTKWSDAVPSVLPGLDNYELDFSGDFHDGDSLDGIATVVGNPSLHLTITAHKIAEAV